MPYFVNDGLRLHYEVYGSGQPVILLHGGAVSFEHNYANFGWIKRLNASGMQVIGLDFRGHGKSDKPHNIDSYGTTKLASDVVALQEHLNLTCTALIAYSIGTAVALYLLHASPQRFSRAALVATGDGLIGFPPYTFSEVIPTIALVLGRTEYPTDLPPQLATYWNIIQQTGADHMALLAFSKSNFPPLSVEEAANIRVPTLVVSGTKDLVLGCGQRLAAALGQGQYFEVEEADHFSLSRKLKVQTAVASFIVTDSEKSQQ